MTLGFSNNPDCQRTGFSLKIVSQTLGILDKPFRIVNETHESRAVGMTLVPSDIYDQLVTDASSGTDVPRPLGFDDDLFTFQ